MSENKESYYARNQIYIKDKWKLIKEIEDEIIKGKHGSNCYLYIRMIAETEILLNLTKNKK